MNFILPIQKNPQREIADFILHSDYSPEQSATPSVVTSEPSTGEMA